MFSLSLPSSLVEAYPLFTPEIDLCSSTSLAPLGLHLLGVREALELTKKNRENLTKVRHCFLKVCHCLMKWSRAPEVEIPWEAERMQGRVPAMYGTMGKTNFGSSFSKKISKVILLCIQVCD
jgi:hypothetical protein